MDTNEKVRNNEVVGVVDLGVASVETKGQPGLPTEGVDQRIPPGISED